MVNSTKNENKLLMKQKYWDQKEEEHIQRGELMGHTGAAHHR